MYQCVAAHSELLCYFVIILNHMVTASTASLVLPVLVFLWATLSIPRPSKRFWMTAIVFTEVGIAGLAVGVRVGGWRPADPSPLQVTVVAKYLFQFGFFPWNSHAVLRRYENKPYFPPRILGLEKSDSYVKYDLLQLMVLFFHRAQLLVSACAPLQDSRLSRTQRTRSHTRRHTRPAILLREAGRTPSVGLATSPALCAAQCGHAGLLTSPPPLSTVLRPLGPRRGPSLEGA